MSKTVRILGTHGVPAAYGGFETAAENIALHLVANGWRVVVYCQTGGTGPVTEDTWRGIERVLIPTPRDGWLGTGTFDWRSIRHASKHGDLCLTFGYNTAGFNVLQRLRHIPNIINMDGIEWKRAKWGLIHKLIFIAHERAAVHIGDHLIADHPEIAKRLRKFAAPSKISTITYGAHAVNSASQGPVRALGLEPGRYLTVICRATPENSVLDIVRAFSARPRGMKLAVLGNYQPNRDSYHRDVMAAASSEVVFPGTVYEQEAIQALRFHSVAYVHGHTVGGTNPSLVEALAAGNPVIAHDNVYNRWVAGDEALYFRAWTDLAHTFDETLDAPERLRDMAEASRQRHRAEFTWEYVAGEYERLLLRHLPGKARGSVQDTYALAGTNRPG